MNTYIGLGRTEHETECHREKVTLISCITKISLITSFLRTQTPYRREGNKEALPFKAFSNPSLRNYPEKLDRIQPFTALLCFTRRQPLHQVCLVIAKVQDIPSPSPTHANQLGKFLACLASFVTTTRTPTLHSINLQSSFLPVIKRNNASANSDSHIHKISAIIFTHPYLSALTHATQID